MSCVCTVVLAASPCLTTRERKTTSSPSPRTMSSCSSSSSVKSGGGVRSTGGLVYSPWTSPRWWSRSHSRRRHQRRREKLRHPLQRWKKVPVSSLLFILFILTSWPIYLIVKGWSHHKVSEQLYSCFFDKYLSFSCLQGKLTALAVELMANKLSRCKRC